MWFGTIHTHVGKIGALRIQERMEVEGANEWRRVGVATCKRMDCA